MRVGIATRAVVRHGPRRAASGVFVLASVWVTVQSYDVTWALDDAYIAFVYARNWVEGHGLVFNVGERVEGYTCFLWVVFLALGFLADVDILAWSAFLGVVSAAAARFATWKLAEELAPRKTHAGAALASLLVAAYLPWRGGPPREWRQCSLHSCRGDAEAERRFSRG